MRCRSRHAWLKKRVGRQLILQATRSRGHSSLRRAAWWNSPASGRSHGCGRDKQSRHRAKGVRSSSSSGWSKKQVRPAGIAVGGYTGGAPQETIPRRGGEKSLRLFCERVRQWEKRGRASLPTAVVGENCHLSDRMPEYIVGPRRITASGLREVSSPLETRRPVARLTLPMRCLPNATCRVQLVLAESQKVGCATANQLLQGPSLANGLSTGAVTPLCDHANLGSPWGIFNMGN